ncbi:CsxC family protein [Chengkuizengella marina]|uniref:DUF7852 domain-containing protein n=1 Tax=Chengkuizengella marina TaxID=2507566 RepID=A0A6N9Q0V3_9BACL|nr:hypothetical protein [Chengkuizengella marina]NBI28947.1 hypothetical protein [Chengkuizengella marina]
MGDCNVKVTPIISDCTAQTTPAKPNTFKLNIVLGTLDCQIDIEADIELDSPALDIKDIDKEVCVTQSEFIEVNNPTLDCELTGKLFMEGYVRKNVRYSSVESATNEEGFGTIRHCTVKLPFNCAVPVEGIFPTFNHNDRNTKSLHGLKSSQFDQSSYQPLNEPVECEINSVTINERNLFRDHTTISHGSKKEDTFTKIREKMVVCLNITLTQKRLVTLKF